MTSSRGTTKTLQYFPYFICSVGFCLLPQILLSIFSIIDIPTLKLPVKLGGRYRRSAAGSHIGWRMVGEIAGR